MDSTYDLDIQLAFGNLYYEAPCGQLILTKDVVNEVKQIEKEEFDIIKRQERAIKERTAMLKKK